MDPDSCSLLQKNPAQTLAHTLLPTVMEKSHAARTSHKCQIREYWALYNEVVQGIVATYILERLNALSHDEQGAYLGCIAFCRKSGDRCLFGSSVDDPFPGTKKDTHKSSWHGMSRTTLKITEGANKEWDGPSKLLFEAMKAVMEELLPLAEAADVPLKTALAAEQST